MEKETKPSLRLSPPVAILGLFLAGAVLELTGLGDALARLSRPPDPAPTPAATPPTQNPPTMKKPTVDAGPISGAVAETRSFVLGRFGLQIAPEGSSPDPSAPRYGFGPGVGFRVLAVRGQDVFLRLLRNDGSDFHTGWARLDEINKALAGEYVGNYR